MFASCPQVVHRVVHRVWIRFSTGGCGYCCPQVCSQVVDCVLWGVLGGSGGICPVGVFVPALFIISLF